MAEAVPLGEWTASRKTPGDGRLEISAAAAERIAPLGREFAMVVAGRPARGSVISMECTCAKGAGARHVHHFVQSDAFRELAVGSTVHLALDERSGLRADPA